MTLRPPYLRVFLTFARNSLVRDMTFRINFLIECASSVTWTLMNLGFYLLIFEYTTSIGAGTGWGKWEFFAFLATTMLVPWSASFAITREGVVCGSQGVTVLRLG